MNNNDYINQWKRENTKLYRIQCNAKNDADIIEILEAQENKSAFIKDCIRAVAKSDTHGGYE